MAIWKMSANEQNMNFNEKLLRKHKITYSKKFFQSEMNIADDPRSANMSSRV